MIDLFNERMKLYKPNKKLDKDCPTYSILSVFFDAVHDALVHMKGHIKLELMLGDYNAELEKLRIGDHEARPADFPSTFTRIWLSNCP